MTPEDEPEPEPDDAPGVEPPEPLDVGPDEIFTAAVGVPEPGDADRAGADSAGSDSAGADSAGADSDDAASGISVYPDAPAAPTPVAATAPPSWGTPRLPPPGGQGFQRRAPHTGPEPDEYGYYPDDYYVPPNWPRLFARLVVAAVLLSALAVAGLELADRFEQSDDDEQRAEPTATPRSEVAVYQCAGDPDPVAQLPPPAAILIAGRTADSRWLAFRNPEPPPLQLWVEARDVPTFVPSTVGVVSCASEPDEFPTPR